MIDEPHILDAEGVPITQQRVEAMIRGGQRLWSLLLSFASRATRAERERDEALTLTERSAEQLRSARAEIRRLLVQLALSRDDEGNGADP